MKYSKINPYVTILNNYNNKTASSLEATVEYRANTQLLKELFIKLTNKTIKIIFRFTETKYASAFMEDILQDEKYIKKPIIISDERGKKLVLNINNKNYLEQDEEKLFYKTLQEKSEEKFAAKRKISDENGTGDVEMEKASLIKKRKNFFLYETKSY